MQRHIFSNVFSNWIVSMSNKGKDKTELPVNIWIDEGGKYKNSGHGKRIKFQLNHARLVQNQPNASMGLDGEVFWKTFNKRKSEINENDIKQVANFVKNNNYALNALSDGFIISDDFDEVMIKGGNPATEEQIEEQKRKVDEIMMKGVR